MQRLFVLLVLVAGTLLAACASQAPVPHVAGPNCPHDGAPGCLSLDFMSVQETGSPLATKLVSGEIKATDAGIGSEFYDAVRLGRLPLDDRCHEAVVNIWTPFKGDIPSGAVQIRTWKINGIGGVTQVGSTPAARTTPSPTLGNDRPADMAYRLVLCGLNSFQVAWNILPPGTYILVCFPDGGMAYPDNSQQKGLAIYPDVLDKWRTGRTRDGKTGIREVGMPVVAASK